ncbi:hypothetical protein QWA68_014908 [Fusarium oxysporum]|nr:hypothetical protein QWA68_014908 [Fusarium oxysporum]
MSPIAVASSKSAAPGGGLTSINAQEIAVFWTTPKNSIDIAFLFEGPYSFRNFQRPLTVAQSMFFYVNATGAVAGLSYES